MNWYTSLYLTLLSTLPALWLECTGMYLTRCSLSLLMTGVHVPLHFLHSTFHKVWHISYLVPISHLPQLLGNISTVFSLYFLKFLFLSCSDRNLAVLWGYCQPRNPFTFSFPWSSYYWTWEGQVSSLLFFQGTCLPSSSLPETHVVGYILNYCCDLPAAAVFSVHWIIGLLSLSDYFLNVAI